MDLDEFRAILGNSGVNIWELLETGIKLACLDYKQEIALHRDRIVAQLYAICPNCDHHDDTRVRASSGNVNVNGDGNDNVDFEAGFGVDEEGYNKVDSPYTPVSIGGGDEIEGEHVHSKQDDQRFVDEENDDDEYDEETRIVHIKEQIDDPHQSEESLVDLLQTLADMDITFKALKETDIGRHVNRLRKHPSNDVKRLVKLLVRKWKDLVDDWVRSNGPVDGSSPQQNVSKNHNMVPDFGYSPNPHNGSSGSDKSEYKPKAVSAHVTPPGRMTPVKPIRAASPASAPLPYKQKEVAIDPERFASARKRLQENYQEAQNAKKQRTIQVMDIHELPKGKAKNSFFGRNKGGFQRH